MMKASLYAWYAHSKKLNMAAYLTMELELLILSVHFTELNHGVLTVCRQRAKHFTRFHHKLLLSNVTKNIENIC